MPGRLVLLLVAAFALASCANARGPNTKTLSFAQMQSINPGVSVNWLLDEYPFARDIRRRPNGSIAQMGYLVTDPQNKGRPLLLVFDENGVLKEKRYGGPIVRPPEDQRGSGRSRR
jgi:hypothetical protein